MANLPLTATLYASQACHKRHTGCGLQLNCRGLLVV